MTINTINQYYQYMCTTKQKNIKTTSDSKNSPAGEKSTPTVSSLSTSVQEPDNNYTEMASVAAENFSHLPGPSAVELLPSATESMNYLGLDQSYPEQHHQNYHQPQPQQQQQQYQGSVVNFDSHNKRRKHTATSMHFEDHKKGVVTNNNNNNNNHHSNERNTSTDNSGSRVPGAYSEIGSNMEMTFTVNPTSNVSGSHTPGAYSEIGMNSQFTGNQKINVSGSHAPGAYSEIGTTSGFVENSRGAEQEQNFFKREIFGIDEENGSNNFMSLMDKKQAEAEAEAEAENENENENETEGQSLTKVQSMPPPASVSVSTSASVSVSSRTSTRRKMLKKKKESSSSSLAKDANLRSWPEIEEVILVGCVVRRFFNNGSLTSNVRKKEDCWQTIKTNYDVAWKQHSLKANVPKPQERTKAALKRHYKVMKERITRNYRRDKINFRDFFERFEQLNLRL